MQVDPIWCATLLSAIAAVLAGVAAVRSRHARADPQTTLALATFGRDLADLRTMLAEDQRRGRDESGSQARDLREELQGLLERLGQGLGERVGGLGRAQAETMEGVLSSLRALAEANERRLGELRKEGEESGKALREEVLRQFAAVGDMLGTRLETGAAQQKERLDGVTGVLHRMTQANGEAHETLRKAVEGRLEILRQDNAAKLEEMRRTVDEKLQGTLEERLGEKFKIVSHHLEQVHRSVGEMQSLASGVGDLKRVLTNVKSRGTWAEVSLGSLLEQVLTPEQFERNVETVGGSGERVEYAVRLPGQGEGESVWLPIDAKFPVEDYERLIEASDRADPVAVETALRGLETRIKLEGAKICKKYVSPPVTTDFAVLYVPTEGLYAEVMRRPGLVDHLQGSCRIVVAGPTNLLALLNSLRMGFRTLAIQKRSSEVWETLSAVKTEFGKYGEVLDLVRKKLGEASNHIDKVATRRRAIDRKLRQVEAMPEAQALDLLALGSLVQDDDDVLHAAE